MLKMPKGTTRKATKAMPKISRSNPVGVAFNANAQRWQRTGGAKAGQFVKGSVAQRFLNAKPPPPNPKMMAGHGKKVAAGLVVGGAAFGMLSNKTGKAVDPSSGLPKGMYNY